MSLTIGELRRLLAEFDALPDETPVVLLKRAEGDDCSPLDSVEEGMYLADSTWSGEYYMTEEQRLAKTDPEDYSVAPEGAVRAIFLWPVN